MRLGDENSTNDFFDCILKYGSYSKPYLRYLSSRKEYEEYREFLDLKIKLWDDQIDYNVEEINRCLLKYQDNTILKKMLYIDKIEILLYEGRVFEADKIYDAIRKDYKNINKKYRKYIAVFLLQYSMISENRVKKFRTWSDLYLSDDRLRLAKKAMKAREYIISGNTPEGIRMYIDAFRCSLRTYQIGSMTKYLNNIIWYLREKHPKTALKLANNLVYNLFYLRDEAGNYFFVLHTLVDIFSENKDHREYIIYEYMDFYSEYLTEEKKVRYNSILKKAAKNKISHEKDSYEINDEITDFIKNNIVSIKDLTDKTGLSRNSISNILNKKTTRINSGTINSMLDYFKTEELPFEFINEKIKAETAEKFRNIPYGSLEPDIIFAGYTSLINKNKYKNVIDNISKYFQTDHFNRKKLYDELSASSDGRRFIVDIFEPKSISKARIELNLNFINKLHNKQKFIHYYFKLSIKEQILFDTFIRNYGRYAKNSDFNFYEPTNKQKYIEMFGIDEKQARLSYWMFEPDKRKKFLSLLKTLDE